MKLDLGNKIRYFRRRDGRTQDNLAEALGVTAQAVSRWESGGSYPDMNLIPSIANYFGVTIDELFGYSNEREQRIQALVSKIQQMKWKNNGQDANLREAIAFARDVLVEYPGEPRLMVCLASVLYTAGYCRYGEHHLRDSEGYDIYDTQRHCQYAEWKEAVPLYEKALENLEDSDFRRIAVGELTQLYVNMGMYEKSRALAEAAPGIYSTKEYMRICACDGKDRVRSYGEAILAMIHASAALVIFGVLAARQHMTAAQKVTAIQNAIRLFDDVCVDGNYGEHNCLIARMYTQLSLYLWQDQKQTEAFDALDKALFHFRQYEALFQKEYPMYTAPLMQLVPVDFSRSTIPDPSQPETTAAGLCTSFPWWQGEGLSQIKEEMQSDPRWSAWVSKCSSPLS